MRVDYSHVWVVECRNKTKHSLKAKYYTKRLRINFSRFRKIRGVEKNQRGGGVKSVSMDSFAIVIKQNIRVAMQTHYVR